jgi:hypothetical protein
MNDLKFALRQLLKNPGFTAVAVLTLALGIGANSALFSVIHAVLIKPLPYQQPDRLVKVQTSVSVPGKAAITLPLWSYPRLELLRDYARPFAQAAAYSTTDLTVVGGGDAERVEAEQVSADYFDLLGLRPALGRVFLAEEDVKPGQAVTIISDSLWQRRFGADLGVVGKTIRANQTVLTILGVLPRGFRGQSGASELWVPITLAPTLEGDPKRLERAGAMWHQVIGRLTPGTSLAGAFGLLLARWVINLMAAFQPAVGHSFFSTYARLPEFRAIRLTTVILGFNFLVALGCTMLCGLIPAWTAVRRPSAAALHRSTGLQAAPWGLPLLGGRSLLVVVETALALVLMIGAGLMGHSFARLTKTDIGFDPADLLTFRLDRPQGLSSEAEARFFQQVLEQVAVLPGVKSVCLANAVPLSGTFDRSLALLQRTGPDGHRVEIPVGVHHASAGYLQTLCVPLLRGRWLTDRDRCGAGLVGVINNTAARRYWPDQNPIGQKLDLSPAISPEYAEVEIVGVVGEAKYDRMEAEIGADVYLSYQQASYPGYYLAVRTAGDPLGVVGAVRKAVASLDPNLPFYDMLTMKQRIADSLSRIEFNALLLSVFAALGLALAVTGVYGVTSYSVARRTHEIGIRVALGAHLGDIMRLVLWQGLRMVLVGGLFGLGAALALTQFLQSLLYKTEPTDPLTFAVVMLGLGLAASLACWLPARRAAKVDPMVALRYE